MLTKRIQGYPVHMAGFLNRFTLHGLTATLADMETLIINPDCEEIPGISGQIDAGITMRRSTRRKTE
jgi:hypothetical protein